ncbi:MAG: hypothetical protein WC124_02035 [Desulfoplanes sp.]
MTKLKGTDGKLYDGSSQIKISQITLNDNMNLIETGTLDSTGEEYTATMASGDISFDGFYDAADGAITGLVTKVRAGTAISCTWILSGTKASGTAIGVTGTFTLDKFSRKAAKKDMVTFSASGKFSGALTDATNL